jgi:hypothetical protein
VGTPQLGSPHRDQCLGPVDLSLVSPKHFPSILWLQNMALQSMVPESATRIGVTIAAFLALYTVGLVVYRRYFHPLSKYPGPFLNSISTLPAALSLIRGRFPFDNKTHHDNYGPVFRLGPNELTFSTANATQDIYGFRQGHQNMKKSPLHTGPVKVGAIANKIPFHRPHVLILERTHDHSTIRA